MPLLITYLSLIMISSTIPLGIKWSGEGPGFLFGVTGRMVLGTILCLLLIKVLRAEVPWHPRARRTYIAAGIGIYGSMICAYWASQYISSGFISVIFGLTPLTTGIMALIWLDERFTIPKVMGIALGVIGLLFIFGTGVKLGYAAIYGIVAVLISVILHSLSTVWVKRIGSTLPAISITGGGLLLATPLYLVTWLIFGNGLPDHVPAKAAASIIYLGIFGSAMGFILYFHALKHMETSKVALIPLITPVIALLMGYLFNDEVIGINVWIGTTLILSGLLLHQWNELFTKEKAPP